MPLSLTLMTSAGMRGARLTEVSSETWKVRRSRLLMPMISRRNAGRFEFFGVVGFHKSGHAASRGQFAEGAELGFVEDGGDQEDGVGSGGGGFEDVVFGRW